MRGFPRWFPLERHPTPAWILLVPLAVIGVAWAVTKKRAEAAAAPLPKGPAKRWVTPRRAARFEPYFQAATRKYRLPPGLLSRQAKHESNYNPSARSKAGALGIMQIIPKWHPSLDPGDAAADAAAALDPARAIPYAAKYLRLLFNQFGSWTLALAAYNAGPGVVKKYRGVPPFRETRAYVTAILPDIGIAQPEPGVRYA